MSDISRPSKRYKKYRPKCLQDVPQLPAIESFHLDTILNETLKTESQQVVDHLLDVTKNYQNDLRQEIKHKLSIEQKIQYKNIQIVKLCNSLIRVLANRRKRIAKAKPESDPDINQLLVSTIDVSDRIKRVTTKLSRIDQPIDKLKFPYLYKMLHPGNKDEEEAEENEEDQIEDEVISYPLQQAPVQNSLDKAPIKDSLDNTPLKSSLDNTSKKISIDSELQNGYNKDPEEVKDSNEALSDNLNDMNPDDFELFISSSIGKYRSLQNKRYENTDPFRHPGHIQDHDLVDNPSLVSDSKKTFHIINNPISLLYSSLITNPNHTNMLSINESSHPFGNLSVKSPATIKQTFQTSHFKKLRINGSPITSESLRAKCKCTEGINKGEHKDKDTNDNKETPDNKDTPENKDTPDNKDKDTNGNDNRSDDAPISPARKLLTESLLAIDSLRLSDDDAWNSSGLNTETDDDMSDPEISSNSSDTSLSSEESASVAETNQYYTSLQTELKHKKKLLKQSILRRRRRRHMRKRIQHNELSPTPKHQPSHHTLKPKGSILKTKLANICNTPKLVSIGFDKTSEERSGSLDFDNKYSEERSGISAVNNAYDSTAKHEVSGMNVAGTILRAEKDPLNDHIRSLEKLKEYID